MLVEEARRAHRADAFARALGAFVQRGLVVLAQVLGTAKEGIYFAQRGSKKTQILTDESPYDFDSDLCVAVLLRVGRPAVGPARGRARDPAGQRLL